MDHLASAIILLLLFAASYSGRRLWAALGSVALSVVVVAGAAFLLTADRAGPFFETLSTRLPTGWDRRARDLAEAAAQITHALTSPRTHRAGTTGARKTHASVSPSPLPHWLGPSPQQTEAPEIQPERTAERTAQGTPKKPAAAPSSPSLPGSEPVQWMADAATPPGTRALLAGTNVSNVPLEAIRATLRPDLGERGIGSNTIRLHVIVDGHGAGDGPRSHTATIPPGAKFYLSSPELTADRAQRGRAQGGAIVSFAYVHDGRRRTSIMYLKQTALRAAR